MVEGCAIDLPKGLDDNGLRQCVKLIDTHLARSIKLATFQIG